MNPSPPPDPYVSTALDAAASLAREARNGLTNALRDLNIAQRTHDPDQVAKANRALAWAARAADRAHNIAASAYIHLKGIAKP